MVVHKTVLRQPFGLEMIAAAVIVVLAATTLWIFIDDPLLPVAFTLIVSGLLALWIVATRIWRWAAKRQRNEADRARQAYIDDIETHLELDVRLQAAYHTATDNRMDQAPQITRTPMSLGQNSRFINYVKIIESGGSVVELVEKGVDSYGEELSFWLTADASALALSDGSYRVLLPTNIVGGDPVSVIYFPYLPALHRDEMELRRDFRANMPAIIAAVAEFTGRNRPPRGGSTAITRYTYPAPRPTTVELQRCMGVSAQGARELLWSIDRIQDEWQIVENAYARLPRSLCHNDISPGNVVHVDNITTFSDFGKAATGPIGSDLHTIIRNSGQAMHDPDHVENLFTTYVEALRPLHDSITVVDVRLAAWTTFYLRYTNLNFSSARYQRPFRLALNQMNGLIQQLRTGQPQ